MTAVYLNDQSKDQNLGMYKYHHSNGNMPIRKEHTMKSQARTIYIDDDTYSNISELANLKRVSISAMIRILINESFFDHVHFKNEVGAANNN